MSAGTEYVLLLPGNEAHWAAASAEEREAAYAVHREFMRLLGERGHTITGGAELEHSSGAVVVTREGEGVHVSEGPYAESVEQITGFYCVRTEKYDDLVELCGVLAGDEGRVEIRKAVQS